MRTRSLFKTTSLTAASLLLGLSGASCSGKEGRAAAPTKTPPPATAEEPLLPPADAQLPTDAEADRDAEASITEQNADAELDKLKDEIEAGGGGG